MRIAVILAVVLMPNVARAQMKWESSFAAAQRAAAQSGKPILLDFYAAWCGPCKLMAEETFADPTVKELLKRVVCVRLDVDRRPAQAVRYGVNSIPRVLLIPAKGGEPTMDVQGFCEAATFAQELRRALGLKPSQPVPPANPELDLLRQALTRRQYAAFKAVNPKAAARGLDRLIAELGVFQESQLEPTATLVRNAGDDAIPALLRGMNHKYLAVRAGSYRTLQAILRETGLRTTLSFDPWASAQTRQSQLQRWLQWWKALPTPQIQPLPRPPSAQQSGA